MARLAKWGRPGARWIVLDFLEAENGVARWWTRAVVRALYAGFRVITGLRVTRLPDYKAALTREGALLCREVRSLDGLWHSTLWKFHLAEDRELPSSGATLRE